MRGNKQIMYKCIINLIIMSSMLLLCSCSVTKSRVDILNKSNDEEIAESRLNEIIKALENQDKDALKALFSEEAVEESDDFDSSMDNLYDFLQGGIDSWEKLDGLTVFESIDEGKTKKEISSYYYVTTDKQKYFFLLRDYPLNTQNPDNTGLYMLLVVKAEDEEKIYDGEQKILYDGDEKLSHAGIYIPIE